MSFRMVLDRNPKMQMHFIKSLYARFKMYLFLIVLKHKNTIIHLQRFRKHAKFKYLFLRKTMLQQVHLIFKLSYFEMCVLCQNV